MPDRRREVLDLLRSAGTSMSILDVARRVGLHPNTVRFHLQSLESSGQVERVESTHARPGRPPLLFRAHRGMDPSGPRNYRLLAEVLVARMGTDSDARAEAVAAGRAWGSRLASSEAAAPAPTDDEATSRLVGLLDDVGFSPERRSAAGAGQIGLHHCPFLDLVPAQTGVVCPVHLGLMQGALAAMGAAITVDKLEPFVEPDLCLAHLGPAALSA
jgi:predicted ArsR family transcriptional regulator